MTTKKSPSIGAPKPAPGQKGVTIATLIRAIQQCLTPDLLKPQYRDGNTRNPRFGHCYHSAEALYHLIRGLNLPTKYHAYRPCRGVDDQGIAHWWLQSERGNILDPTVEQYTSRGANPPYDAGRFRNFMTKQPSKRAMVLISRVTLSE